MNNEYIDENIKNDLYLRDLLLGKIKGPLTGFPSKDKPWLKYYTEEAIKFNMPSMTIYNYLFENNKKYMYRTALNYFGRKITFKELFENIEIVEKSFISQGVKKGDIVTISMPNTPEAVYMFYALSKIGAISNMIDPRTSSEGIEEYINEAESKLLIIIDAAYDKVKKLKNTTIEKIVTVSPADSLPLGLNLGYKAKKFIENLKKKEKDTIKNTNKILWKDFLEKGKSIKNNINYENLSGDTPVVIVHTGGTTGFPKGVLLSNDNINAVAYQSVLTDIDMQREHNWLDIMPPFIAYGVGMGLHLPLTIGMETILIPQFDAKKFDELLVKYKPIHMVGVPSYWGTIINSKKLKNKDLSYIIAPTVGGDAMDNTLEVESNKYLKNHGCKYKITKGYGMTEVTGGVAGTVDKNNEIGSVGIPFVKTVISIFDPETGKELGYNQNGEICITGPNVMLGYFKNDEATKNMLRVHEDGKTWVHSNDIGYMTENGNIFVIDRIKNMIIRYDGFKIFPSLIETAILEHPAVESCKIVGMDDVEHSQGKLPCAVIVLKDKYIIKNIAEIEKEISLLCEAKLPEYAQPRAYRFKNEFPLTTIGKINVLELEKEINEEIKSSIKVKKMVND